MTAAAAADQNTGEDDDGFYSHLVAADELQDAADGTAADVEEPAHSAASSNAAGDVAVGTQPGDAGALDLYADAAYWQDDSTTAQTAATAPRPKSQACSSRTIGMTTVIFYCILQCVASVELGLNVWGQ